MQAAIIKTSTSTVEAILEVGNLSDCSNTYNPSTYTFVACTTRMYDGSGNAVVDGSYVDTGGSCKYDSTSGRFYPWQVPEGKTNWTLNSNFRWEAPTAPPDGWIDPNIYNPWEEVSDGYRWDDDNQSWVARTTSLTDLNGD